MHLWKNVLVLGLALLSSVSPASAGEPPAELAADRAAVETAPASDIFGTSVLSSAQDCGAESQQVSGLVTMCGACSTASCQGVELFETCNGGIGYCRNFPLNKTCGANGPPKCVCSTEL